MFADARERWRGRIDLQASPLFGVDFVALPGHLEEIERNIDAHGSKLLGAVTYMIAGLRQSLEVLFSLAERKGYDLDFHVDETADPAARSLAVIAETAIARKFAGKILVGHCCSLARQADDERKRTIDLVAEAGLSVVSLPMCNMFLQDRQAGRTPRWRGVTAVHELKAAGANVMIASDNTRDPFYAYGDLDMLEVWREGARILHLDYPFAAWSHAVGASPAKAMGIEFAGLAEGAAGGLHCDGGAQLHRAFLTAAIRSRRRAQRQRDFNDPAALRRTRFPRRSRPMSTTYDIAGFVERIGGIRCEENPTLVKQKSRDFYWYSPVLKRELDAVSADVMVSPTNEQEVKAVLAAAHALAIPVTPRGGATGNYGQAMPLNGGVLMNLDGLQQGEVDLGRPRRFGAGRAHGRARPARRRIGPGIAHVSLYPRDRNHRGLRGGRLGRGRLDHLGRLARFRECFAVARADDGKRTPRSRTGRRRVAQGRARLWHQRNHHRSRNAARGEI